MFGHRPQHLRNEFDKKFRKSDDFTKDVAEDKIESFAKILQKFFDSEMEDYEKEAGAKTPDYDVLQRKAAQKVYDFSLKQRIVEVDRDADRRYMFASEKIKEYNLKGEEYPQSSPFREVWKFKNDDELSHQSAQFVLDFIKTANDAPDAPASAKPAVAELVKAGIPAMGETLEMELPQVLVKQLTFGLGRLQKMVTEYGENHTEAELQDFQQNQVPWIWGQVINDLTKKYVNARDEVEKETQDLKTFFRSQKDRPGKTKADILKEIWAELPKHTDRPVPPLDEEMLAELAVHAAVDKDIGEFKHNWGTADKLYKSEAIDSFGEKYLLGVFETPQEAQKAFDAWNIEYEKARVAMKEESLQWGKQEQARVDADTSGQERIQKALEEARR